MKLDRHGIFIGPRLERLTNTRYADDILVYASTLDELSTMTKLLIDELKEVGLELNYKKTKILPTHDANEFNDIDYVEMKNSSKYFMTTYFIDILADIYVSRLVIVLI